MWEGPLALSFFLSDVDIKKISITSKHFYGYFKSWTLAAIIIKNAIRKAISFKMHSDWINYCIKCAVNSHGCPWRLSISGLPRMSGFSSGAVDWHKWENVVNFYSLRGRILWCVCDNPVDTCTYRSIGEKMRCSTPMLTFQCSRCLLSELVHDEYFYESYQEPMTCSFRDSLQRRLLRMKISEEQSGHSCGAVNFGVAPVVP